MKLQIYRDKKGEWRWSVVAKNGKIIAEGGEGYKSRKSMMKNLHRFLYLASKVALVAYTETFPK